MQFVLEWSIHMVGFAFDLPSPFHERHRELREKVSAYKSALLFIGLLLYDAKPVVFKWGFREM